MSLYRYKNNTTKAQIQNEYNYLKLILNETSLTFLFKILVTKLLHIKKMLFRHITNTS